MTIMRGNEWSVVCSVDMRHCIGGFSLYDISQKEAEIWSVITDSSQID